MTKGLVVKTKILLFILLFALCSCGAPLHTNVTPDMRVQMLNEFKSGTLVLTDNSLSTDLNFINAKYDIARAFVDNQWERMVVLIMQNGHEKDISYFLLGVAAEKLGYLPAALKYYQYAARLYQDQFNSHHCRAYNECFGIDLSAVIPKLINQVQRTMKRQEEMEAEAARQAMEQTQKDNKKRQKASASTSQKTAKTQDASRPKVSSEPQEPSQTDPFLTESMREILKQSGSGQPQAAPPTATPSPAKTTVAPATETTSPVYDSGKTTPIAIQPAPVQNPKRDAPKKSEKQKSDDDYSE